MKSVTRGDCLGMMLAFCGCCYAGYAHDKKSIQVSWHHSRHRTKRCVAVTLLKTTTMAPDPQATQNSRKIAAAKEVLCLVSWTASLLQALRSKRQSFGCAIEHSESSVASNSEVLNRCIQYILRRREGSRIKRLAFEVETQE